MGKLIIEGNSVYEIDEECIKKRKPLPACDIDKYFSVQENENDLNAEESKNTK